MVPTLADLVGDNARSQLALGLEAYLQALVDLTAWTDNDKVFVFLPDNLTPEAAAVQLYQLPEVVNLERLDDETNARRKALDERGEFGRGEQAPSSEPWNIHNVEPGLTVVLGRPGEGKTLLTRLGCRDVALKSLEVLRSRTKRLDEIAIPIWLRFEDLLQAEQKLRGDRRDRKRHDPPEEPRVTRFGALQVALDDAVPRLVAAAVQRAYGDRDDAPSPRNAEAHIRSALTRASTWLFIDALDEKGAVTGYNTRAATAGLKELNPNVRVVTTCRKHEYQRREILGVDRRGDRLHEFDLEPLGKEQQERFVREWFRPEPTDDMANDVLALVAGDAEFQDMAGNALMLTLICDTRSRHPIGPGTRRVQLYNLVLRDIVRRARTTTRWLAENDTHVDRRLRVLRHVVWQFFVAAPAERSLDLDMWTVVWRKACREEEIPNSVSFEQAMRAEGLLVSYPGAVRFLHRSFFEFLAGARMARAGEDEVVTQFQAHAADGAWRNVLVMGMGCMALLSSNLDPARRQAGAVVDRLLSGPSSPPGVIVALLGDAIVDAGKSSIPDDVCQRLREALLRTMRSDGIDGRDPRVEPKVRAAAGSALGRLGDHRFHGEDLWCLPKSLSDPGPDGTLPPEPNLGFVEIEEGEFWMGSNVK